MNKKIISTSILLGLLVLSLWQRVPITYGQEDASPSAETTQNLKERIQRVVKEREEEIKGVIEDLSKRKQAFIGQVERVSGDTLSVKTIKDTRIVAIDENVTLLKDNKTIEVKDIAVGDWLVCMGILEDDNFAAKRILVSTESLRPKNYTVALGSISDISKTSLAFQARSETNSTTLTFNKSTSYQDLNGKKITASLLENDMQALVIYYEEELTETQKTSGEKAENIITVIRILSALETDEE